MTTEPSCFDPHRSSQQAAFFVARNYIDSLVGKKSDGTFAPWLATEWSISPDGKEYTFKLREDVVFHDGEKFDAAAVKANFDFVKKPENAATAASLLEYYGGAEIVSPYVVKFVLTRPDSTFLESTSNVQTRPDLADSAGEGRSLRRRSGIGRDRSLSFSIVMSGDSRRRSLATRPITGRRATLPTMDRPISIR